MSLFTDSSLCLVPSGVKDGKLYSVKPTDGSGDLTFSRGSDIEATRVAANGYIEKAKVNLLVQSNTFSTTWSFYQGFSAPIGGQSGYDGTNDAWSLVPNTNPDSHNISQAVTKSGATTLSVYAKANGYDHILLYDGDINAGNFFNVASGSVGSAYNGGAIDANIESVGNGYYRCSLTYSVSGSGTAHIFVCSADGVFIFSGNNTDGILIQDAQLNYGLVAQDYVETTTTSVVAGITNDMPRLDYSGGASCPSLLLEPSRTNVITSSEYIGAWGFAGVTATANAITSPEGVANAYKLTEDTSNGVHLAFLSNLFAATGAWHSASIFVKAAGRNY